tara:strand:- start:4110 stop:6524 length:2415 start_codon:yes stop_codon:yes gene_type:complete
MFKNYLITAWRHLVNARLNSLIGIVGLAVGLCCALLISLYIEDETSYDQFHEKKAYIARIVERIDHSGEVKAALTSFPVGPQFVADYPEVESFTRIMPMQDGQTVKVKDQVFREDKFYRADSSLFDIFSFPLLIGDPKEVLAAPFQVVLNEELALKYFGQVDSAVGKRVNIGGNWHNISGVVANLSEPSDINYRAFVSMSSIPMQAQQALNQDWFRLVTQTYLLFNVPVEALDFDAKLADFTERIIKPFVASFGNESTADFTLQPIEGLHFDNSREFDTPKGNLSYLFIFGLLGLFILLIAAINFVNLNLSQSLKRSKEVGVRKALGASKLQIRGQFFGETILIVFLATFLALVLVEAFLPVFNQVTNKNFILGDLMQFKMLLAILALMGICSLIAGLYPALVLSSFQPSRILRADLPKIGRFGNLQRFLMLLQLGFSIFMIVGTIAIYSQMKFLQEKELGFDKDQVIVLNLPQDTAISNNLSFLKDRLLSHSQVKTISGSQTMPGGRTGELMFRVEQDGVLQDKTVKFLRVDEDFFKLLDLEIVAGRSFSADIQTDFQQGFIVNETAAERFGWAGEALGKRVQWGLLANNQAANDGAVVGVVKDFHVASLHNPLEPLIILFNPFFSQVFSIKLSGGSVAEGLEVIEKEWSDFAGSHALEYEFLDSRIEKQYQSEKTLLQIFSYFSILSILIAGLGLFALTSFTVEQRLKEFSIRKIVGAELSDLSILIGREFLILIVVASLIVSPVALYGINEWLLGFSYRINLPYYALFLASLLSLVITILAIAYHIVKLARTNPARILRDE